MEKTNSNRLMVMPMSEFEGITVRQSFPDKGTIPLEGLYLGQNLREIAGKIGGRLVFADFLTDKNGVVAKAVKPPHFIVPPEIKNKYDWRLFQELMAQADVIISTGAYFRRLAAVGKAAQDIIYQFELGNEFEDLGLWRLKAGYKNRSPDLAVISHHLDFDFPEEIRRNGREITIFTTDTEADSNKAVILRDMGISVTGCGQAGVNGKLLIDSLAGEMGYSVIMMASGPGVLDLLLEAQQLDLLYITQVQLEIPDENLAMLRKLKYAGNAAEEIKRFTLVHKFTQENAIAENGTRISQVFIRYDRNKPQNGLVKKLGGRPT